MRALSMLLLGLLAAAMAVLLAGCGGGGGTDPIPVVEYPDPDIFETYVTYTPTDQMDVRMVTAKFEKPDGTKTFDAIPFHVRTGSTWELSFTGQNNDFSESASGRYDMTVYILLADQENPVQVGQKTQVTLSISADNGSGPPPPPEWPQ